MMFYRGVMVLIISREKPVEIHCWVGMAMMFYWGVVIMM